VAARRVSLEEQLQPVRLLLISWRQQEVRGWEKLLDEVEREFRLSAQLTSLKAGLLIDSFAAASVGLVWLHIMGLVAFREIDFNFLVLTVVNLC